MAANSKLKMTGLQNDEIREMNRILIDLKATIQTLSKVAVRLEKCLKGYEQPAINDEDGFHSAEEDIKTDVKSVRERAKKLKKQSKKVVSKAERPKTGSYNVRRFSREKSLTNEAINETVVTNIENDKKNKTALVRKEHVREIKKRFELKHSKNTDSDESSNVESLSEKIVKEETKVNVRSLKEKFEQEKSKTEKPKIEEKVKVADEQPNEYEEKVKKVLKYFQPNRY